MIPCFLKQAKSFPFQKEVVGQSGSSWQVCLVTLPVDYPQWLWCFYHGTGDQSVDGISQMVSICVLSLNNCINVDQSGSKKVFKFALLVGTLFAHPMKSLVIICSWTVAGRDCGHLLSNNFFSSFARSDFLDFWR